MFKKWLVSALLCVSGGLMHVHVSAAAIELQYTGIMGGGPSLTGVISAGGSERNTPVGMLHFQNTTTSKAVDGFCIEPEIWVKPGPRSYEIQTFDNAFDTQKQSLIAKLYDDHYAAARSNAQTSAIFQLVLWEILSDLPGAYDLHSGNFQVKSGGLLSLVATSSLWLDDLASWYDTLGGALYESQKYNFMVLKSKDSQGQIVVVSEPGMIMLSAFGLLLGVGFIRNRKTLKR